MASACTRRRYDVFLSFRGDIRKGFTGHLYAALNRCGIHTFIDEDKIEYGVEIGSACLKAIEESRFSIIVLSKNYAFSPSCLEELAHILKWKKPDQIWPIFCDVDPSDIDELKGSYKEAFVEHDKNLKKDKVEEWRAALKKVVYLKGLDMQNHLDGNEAKNIDHIVEEISNRLNFVMLNVAIHPVGLESRAMQVISLMANQLKDFRIIGIYGMGGIGKTTIAKEVYNFVFQKFDCSCFLGNVREQSISKGIAYLQRQLLFETLKRKHEEIHNADRGLNVIKERLRCKRVLIVLDDVDKLDQVNKILGKCDWLSPESRVIITTRTKDFLHQPEYWQYEVKELDYSHSLLLLSLHAFGKSRPPQDYKDCTEEFILYAGGIPLALEVLGSSLCGQGLDVWKNRLEKLKMVGNEDIFGILKISYDSLDDNQKSIFLDIASFFIGYNKNHVIRILEAYCYFPIDEINALTSKCMVKVDYDKKLVMHDLVRDMGREICRRQHADPGERSRLWHHEDVISVLEDDAGTKAVEGLVLNMPGLEHSWRTQAFKEMKKLRVLQLNHVHLTGDYRYISRKLRCLSWYGFPLKSIPSEFCLESLIYLDMRCSSLEQFSKKRKSMKKLKFLNLNHSHKLIETPDFEGCPCLEELMLKDCIRLVKIPNTIELLTHLLHLNLQNCKELRSLPERIGGMKSLKELNLSGCSKLEKLPESIGTLTSLILLDLGYCKRLKDLPRRIGCLKSLQKLNMSGCSKLEKLPKSFVFLVGLGFCNLRNCKSLINLPQGIGSLKSLEQLDMTGCSNVKKLPFCTGNLKSLKVLYLNGTGVQFLPPSFQHKQLQVSGWDVTSKGWFDIRRSPIDMQLVDMELVHTTFGPSRIENAGIRWVCHRMGYYC